MRVWVESGGETGGAEVYTHPDATIAHIDWDNWNAGDYDPDDVFYWLQEFGDVMPKATRAELLTSLAPDNEHYRK